MLQSMKKRTYISAVKLQNELQNELQNSPTMNEERSEQALSEKMIESR